MAKTDLEKIIKQSKKKLLLVGFGPLEFFENTMFPDDIRAYDTFYFSTDIKDRLDKDPKLMRRLFAPFKQENKPDTQPRITPKIEGREPTLEINTVKASPDYEVMLGKNFVDSKGKLNAGLDLTAALSNTALPAFKIVELPKRASEKELIAAHRTLRMLSTQLGITPSENDRPYAVIHLIEPDARYDHLILSRTKIPNRHLDPLLLKIINTSANRTGLDEQEKKIFNSEYAPLLQKMIPALINATAGQPFFDNASELSDLLANTVIKTRTDSDHTVGESTLKQIKIILEGVDWDSAGFRYNEINHMLLHATQASYSRTNPALNQVISTAIEKYKDEISQGDVFLTQTLKIINDPDNEDLRDYLSNLTVALVTDQESFADTQPIVKQYAEKAHRFTGEAAKMYLQVATDAVKRREILSAPDKEHKEEARTDTFNHHDKTITELLSKYATIPFEQPEEAAPEAHHKAEIENRGIRNILYRARDSIKTLIDRAMKTSAQTPDSAEQLAEFESALKLRRFILYTGKMISQKDPAAEDVFYSAVESIDVENLPPAEDREQSFRDKVNIAEIYATSKKRDALKDLAEYAIKDDTVPSEEFFMQCDNLLSQIESPLDKDVAEIILNDATEHDMAAALENAQEITDIILSLPKNERDELLNGVKTDVTPNLRTSLKKQIAEAQKFLRKVSAEAENTFGKNATFEEIDIFIEDNITHDPSVKPHQLSAYFARKEKESFDGRRAIKSAAQNRKSLSYEKADPLVLRSLSDEERNAYQTFLENGAHIRAYKEIADLPIMLADKKTYDRELFMKRLCYLNPTTIPQMRDYTPDQIAKMIHAMRFLSRIPPALQDETEDMIESIFSNYHNDGLDKLLIATSAATHAHNEHQKPFLKIIQKLAKSYDAEKFENALSEVWICAYGGETPLPEDASDYVVDRATEYIKQVNEALDSPANRWKDPEKIVEKLAADKKDAEDKILQAKDAEKLADLLKRQEDEAAREQAKKDKEAKDAEDKRLAEEKAEQARLAKEKADAERKLFAKRAANAPEEPAPGTDQESQSNDQSGGKSMSDDTNTSQSDAGTRAATSDTTLEAAVTDAEQTASTPTDAEEQIPKYEPPKAPFWERVHKRIAIGAIAALVCAAVYVNIGDNPTQKTGYNDGSGIDRIANSAGTNWSKPLYTFPCLIQKLNEQREAKLARETSTPTANDYALAYADANTKKTASSKPAVDSPNNPKGQGNRTYRSHKGGHKWADGYARSHKMLENHPGIDLSQYHNNGVRYVDEASQKLHEKFLARSMARMEAESAAKAAAETTPTEPQQEPVRDNRFLQ